MGFIQSKGSLLLALSTVYPNNANKILFIKFSVLYNKHIGINMTIYRNIGGSSLVSKYEIGEDYIIVVFEWDPVKYRYDYTNPGKDHVEKMKRFAKLGQGLNSYILKYAGKNFSHKS